MFILRVALSDQCGISIASMILRGRIKSIYNQKTPEQSAFYSTVSINRGRAPLDNVNRAMIPVWQQSINHSITHSFISIVSRHLLKDTCKVMRNQMKYNFVLCSCFINSATFSSPPDQGCCMACDPWYVKQPTQHHRMKLFKDEVWKTQKPRLYC